MFYQLKPNIGIPWAILDTSYLLLKHFQNLHPDEIMLCGIATELVDVDSQHMNAGWCCWEEANTIWIFIIYQL